MDMLSYLATFFVLHLYYHGCHGNDGISWEVSISSATVKPGESTVLTCKAIYPSDVTVMFQWRRRLADNTHVDLGTNYVAEERFTRYTINYEAAEDTETKTTEATFNLTIADAKLEDSGELGCAVIPSPGSVKSVYKYKKFTVLANVKSLVIKSSVEGEEGSEETFENEDGELILDEGEKRTFRCEAKGSYPAAEVAVKFGDKDVTKLFESADDPAYGSVDGKKGDIAKLIINKAREIEGYDVLLKTIDPMVVNYTFNNKMLNCVSTMPDNAYPQSVASVRLKLAGFKPHFLCESSKLAKMHEVNVTISCNVIASPPVQTLKFYWDKDPKHDDNNSIILIPGKKNGLYLADVFTNQEPDQTVMSLTIDRLSNEHFRTYFFAATNNYSTVVHAIKLQVKDAVQQQGSAGGVESAAGRAVMMLGPAHTALLLLLACFRLL